MGGEAFFVGDADDLGCGGFKVVGVIGDDTGLFDEVIDVEGAEEPGRAAGGQGVGWAGEVVAGGDGAVVADESGSGIGDLFSDGIAVAALDLKMFHGEGVGQFDGLIKGGGDDGQGIVADVLFGIGTAGQLGELLVDFFGDLGSEGITVGEQYGAAGRMFGLAEHVGGDPGGIGGVVGDDEDLTGAGEAVDIDQAEDLFFGELAPPVAGPDDFIDAFDSIGAEGEGGDGLGAADAVDVVDAEFVADSHNGGVDGAIEAG